MTFLPDDPWAPPERLAAEPGDGWLPPPAPGAGGAGIARSWLRTVVVVASLVVLLGAPIGLLWVYAGPGISVSDEASGNPSLPRAETKESFTLDASFLLLTSLAGVVCGVVVWQLYRRRQSTAAPIGLAIGSVLAALVARDVGQRVVVGDVVRKACLAETGPDAPSAFCTYFDGRLQMRVTGFVFAWALAAMVTWFTFTALRDHEDPPSSFPERLSSFPE